MGSRGHGVTDFSCCWPHHSPVNRAASWVSGGAHAVCCFSRSGYMKAERLKEIYRGGLEGLGGLEGPQAELPQPRNQTNNPGCCCGILNVMQMFQLCPSLGTSVATKHEVIPPHFFCVNLSLLPRQCHQLRKSGVPCQDVQPRCHGDSWCKRWWLVARLWCVGEGENSRAEPTLLFLGVNMV